METSPFDYIVPEEDANTRLDKWLHAQHEDLSRARIQQLVKEGHVLVNGATAANALKLRSGDAVYFTLPPPVSTDTVPNSEIPLTIVYEDDDLLVIDKQAGLTVHPGAGNYQDTLVNALLYYCGDSLSGIGGEMRPGIVHRLDKDTTGLMVVAKHDKAHNFLADQLQDRSLSREYLALIWGTPMPPRATVKTYIDRHPKDRTRMYVPHHPSHQAREAVTHFTVEETFLQNKVSLILCKLETGRTHQIRVHMHHHGFPLIGDKTYGKTIGSLPAGVDKTVKEALHHFPRQALHAHRIGFVHPSTHEVMQFESNFSAGSGESMSKLVEMIRNVG